MKSFSLFLLIFLMIMPAAFAQDVFINRNKDTGEIDVQPKVQKEAPAPKTESIESKANLFYKNCLKQDHPILKGENLKMFCSCTYTEMLGVMTPEQIRAMGTDTAEGQFQRNRMTLFVYTPCITYPTRALILNQCLNNPETRKAMKNPKATCGCLANNMADYMRREAPAVMERALQMDPKNTDPLRTLLDSPEFDMKTQAYMRMCVAEHELGQDLH